MKTTAEDDIQPAPGPVGMGPPPFMGTVAPAADPPLSDMLCLKGPCVHLWEIQTSFPAGNPAGTFAPGEEPRHNQRECQFGSRMDIEGGCVFECNQWRPRQPWFKRLFNWLRRRKPNAATTLSTFNFKPEDEDDDLFDDEEDTSTNE